MIADMTLQKVVSGAQTGADRAALDWAIFRDIPHGGWCPKGRKTKDGTIPGFVNAEGRKVLTALQHRLRELGESTEIVIVK